MIDHDLYAGFVRLHILHHAANGGVFGFGMITELRRHGYNLSPGTLYPILQRLEKRGFIVSKRQTVQGRIRRVYHITPIGRQAFNDARKKAQELFAELVEEA